VTKRQPTNRQEIPACCVCLVGVYGGLASEETQTVDRFYLIREARGREKDFWQKENIFILHPLPQKQSKLEPLGKVRVKFRNHNKNSQPHICTI